MARTPEVKGFAGEDRFNPFPPPNVAADGLNNDYSRGTLRKRKGFVRLHSNRMHTGGVLIENKVSAGAVKIPYIAAYAPPAGAFTASISVRPIAIPDGGATIVGNYKSADNTGWKLEILKHSNGRFYFWVSAGTGLATVTHRSATTDYVNMGQTYQLEFGLDSLGRLFIAVDGTRYTDGVTGVSCADSGQDIILGNDPTPAAKTHSLVVDEFRLWDEEVDALVLAAYRGRELLSTEITAHLVGYWKFNECAYGVNRATDYSANTNDAIFIPADVLTFGESLVEAVSGDFGSVSVDGASQYLFAPYVASWASCWTGYTWSTEGWVTLNKGHASNATICCIGDDGALLCGIRFDGTTNLIEVEFDRDTVGTTVHATGYTAVIGRPFHISVSYFYRWLTVTIIDALGEDITTTDLSTQYAGPAIPGSPSTYFGINLGANATAAGGHTLFAPVTLDDWRFSSKFLDYSEIVDNYDKELTDLTDCKWYSHLDRDNYTEDVVGNSDIVEWDGASLRPRWSMGLVSDKVISPVLGLAPMNTPSGVNDVLLITASDAYSLQNSSAVHLDAFVHPSNARRSHTFFHDTAILFNGETEPVKYDGEDVPMALTPPEPVVSSITAVAGSGTGLTGVYKYKFQYIGGRDDSRGPVSLTPVTTASLSNKDVDIALIPATYDRQVTAVRIYRTKSGEDVFYRLADITAPAPGATGSYTDNAADATLTEAEDIYLGITPACKFCFTHQEKVFAGNYAGFESRLRHSEAGYFERWYFDNYIDFGRGDGDVLVGGISIGHRALLVKRHSLWLLEGPPYAAIKFWDGSGCVSGNTLAVGEQGVYMLSASGVMVWDGQSLPAKVGGDSQNPIWETMNESRWPFAHGVYFPPTQEYWVTFDVEDGSRVTMVWSERKQAWAKTDLDIDAYAAVPLSGGSMSLLGAFHGYCVELRRGDNDGGTVNTTTRVLGGDVTFGSAGYFSGGDALDTTSAWTEGLNVDLIAPDYTRQRRTIWHQNETDLYVTEAWTTTPDNTYLYELAPIDWFWESGPLHFGEDLPDVGIRMADVLFNPQGTDVNVQLEHWGDGDPGTVTTLTVT